MLKLKLLVIMFFVVVGVATLFTDNAANRTAHARSTGPDAGFTKAPGEFDCAECHLIESPGTGRISITVPPSYVPGQTYQITVAHTNTDQTRRRWGFQLTALGDNNERAGTLESLDPTTQTLDGQGPFPSRQYIEHTFDGTYTGQQGGASWTFRWLAPATNVGPVTFYTAGNQANNDGNTSGDNIYFTFATTTPDAPAPPTLAFSASSYDAPEASGSATITVTLTSGSSVPATVNYSTADATANDRSDYTAALGTLRFAAGETTKTFSVFITDDAHVEGTETFNLQLTNPTGATLAAPNAAVLRISDNDASPANANPIDASPFFVRQNYIDFLNREPDAAGLNFWTNQIAACGADAACIELRRVNVSAAFFLSIEFQQTGYLVYRFHQAAFDTGVRLRLRDFLSDTQEIGRGVVVNAPGWEQLLESNKRAFAGEFVMRPQFVARYPQTMTPEQFVDALNANTGGALSPSERDDLATRLRSERLSRAEVLRVVAEDADFNRQEFNRAFVLMQYVGYLRRNPDDAPDNNLDGYNFWLAKLDQFGGNFVEAEMVKAFINSSEYRQRFGP